MLVTAPGMPQLASTTMSPSSGPDIRRPPVSWWDSRVRVLSTGGVGDEHRMEALADRLERGAHPVADRDALVGQVGHEADALDAVQLDEADDEGRVAGPAGQERAAHHRARVDPARRRHALPHELAAGAVAARGIGV